MTFAVLITFGTVLLYMPGSASKPISLIDCLFTATSAVCVTGLNAVDVTEFTLQGKIILILLMQLGGLGIMSLSTALLLLVKKHIGLEDRLIMSNINEPLSFKEIDGILRITIKYTLTIEAIGMLLLIPGFWQKAGGHLGKALLYSVFHAVSGFCNAGFSTFGDNLMTCNSWVKIVVASLIICGGLGFYVVYDLMHCKRNNYRLRIHSKIVILTTFALLLGGTVMIKSIELGNISWLDAFFQSTSTRTAGFNSVDLTQLHPTTNLTMILLMIVGASPMSTGGGIKTTTFFIIVFYIYSLCKGRNQAVLFKRNIPLENIMKAFTLAVCYIICLLLATLVLMLIGEYSVESALYETASALGTVGLSLGISMKAGFAAKLLLILCMFIGRIGPLAFFMFLIYKEKESMLSYPDERIILG